MPRCLCCDHTIAKAPLPLAQLQALGISVHGLQHGSDGMLRSKETPLRVCCNAMLSAYSHSIPVQALRAQHVLVGMLKCARAATLQRLPFAQFNCTHGVALLLPAL